MEHHRKTRQRVITGHPQWHEHSLEIFDARQTWRDDSAAFLPTICPLVCVDSKDSRCVWKDSEFVEADLMTRFCQHVAHLVEKSCGRVPNEVLDLEDIERIQESLAPPKSPEIAQQEDTSHA